MVAPLAAPVPAAGRSLEMLSLLLFCGDVVAAYHALSGAHQGCPCRGSGIGVLLDASPQHWNGYPAEYGSSCKAWDAHRPPTCAFGNGTVKPSAPSWCGAPWCWVDETNCSNAAGAAFSSSFWDFSGLFFSYDTCSGGAGSSTALSDLRTGASNWIPGGNQQLDTVPERALMTLSSIWGPFTLNFLTTAALHSGFVELAQTEMISRLIFSEYVGFLDWVSGTGDFANQAIKPDSVYLSTPSGVFIQWKPPQPRLNRTWEKSVRVPGNSTAQQQNWGQWTPDTVTGGCVGSSTCSAPNGTVVSTDCALYTGNLTCHDDNFTNSFSVNSTAHPQDLTQWTVYDPRQRPWYISALQTYADTNETARSSEVYAYAVTMELGLTATAVVVDSAGAIRSVLGIDFLLRDISTTLKSWYPHPHHEFTFIVQPDWMLVAASDGEVIDHETGERISAANLNAATVTAAQSMIADSYATLVEIGWPPATVTYRVRAKYGPRVITAARIKLMSIEWLFVHVRTYICSDQKNSYMSISAVIGHGEASNGRPPGCQKCPLGMIAAGDGLSCSTCPAGRHADDNYGTCEQCEAGKFSVPPAASCEQCPAFQDSSPNFDGCVCAKGFFALWAGDACSRCSAVITSVPKRIFEGSISTADLTDACPGGAAGVSAGICPQDGLWVERLPAATDQSVSPTERLEILACESESACVAGNCSAWFNQGGIAKGTSCGKGYEGFLCTQCAAGYTKISNRCIVCQNVSWPLLAAHILFNLLVAFFLLHKSTGMTVSAEEFESVWRKVDVNCTDTLPLSGGNKVGAESREPQPQSPQSGDPQRKPTVLPPFTRRTVWQEEEAEELFCCRRGHSVKPVQDQDHEEDHQEGESVVDVLRLCGEYLQKEQIDDIEFWVSEFAVNPEEAKQIRELHLMSINVFCRRQSLKSSTARVPIAIFFCQTCGLFITPGAFKALTLALNLAGEEATGSCLGAMTFAERWIVKVFVMPVALTVLLCLVCPLWNALRPQPCLQWVFSGSPKKITAHTLNRAMLNLYIFLFAPVTRTAVTALACTSPCEHHDQCPHVSRLTFDMAVECYTPEYWRLITAAAGVLIIMGIIYPAHLLHRANKARRRRDISLALKLDGQWWEELDTNHSHSLKLSEVSVLLARMYAGTEPDSKTGNQSTKAAKLLMDELPTNEDNEVSKQVFQNWYKKRVRALQETPYDAMFQLTVIGKHWWFFWTLFLKALINIFFVFGKAGSWNWQLYFHLLFAASLGLLVYRLR